MIDQQDMNVRVSDCIELLQFALPHSGGQLREIGLDDPHQPWMARDKVARGFERGTFAQIVDVGLERQATYVERTYHGRHLDGFRPRSEGG